MGLFEKKFCDICGEKIGLLGNRKLEDGNLCKDCARKLSPWFSDRRKSTINDIKEQLAYRELNKNAVANFNPTKTLGFGRQALLIDEARGKFTVCNPSTLRTSNPDIVDLGKVTDVKFEISEDKDEIMDKGEDGKEVSFNPPRYTCTYEFKIRILVNHTYFDDMYFDITNDEVEKELVEYAGNTVVSRQLNPEYKKADDCGRDIVKILTGRDVESTAVLSDEVVAAPVTDATEAPVVGEFVHNYTNVGKLPIPYRYVNKDSGIDLNVSLCVDCDAKFSVTDQAKYEAMGAAVPELINNGLGSAIVIALQKQDQAGVSPLVLRGKQGEIFSDVKSNIGIVELTAGIALNSLTFNKIELDENAVNILNKLGVNVTYSANVSEEWYCSECGTKNTGKFCQNCGTKRL